MGSYDELVAALAGDEISCYLQSPDQLVVSAQAGAPWPDRGNSFWVTRAGGAWHLFTWAPRGYLIPPSSDVAALCRVWGMYEPRDKRHGGRAGWDRRAIRAA
jgi:hypothetical protein